MKIKLSRAAAAVAFACSAIATSVLAHAAGPAAKPLDLGATPGATAQSVSIVLKIQNIDQLEQYVAGTVTPGSPVYQQFLSTNAFRQNFAPSDSVVRFITRAMAAQGITVQDVMSNNLVIHATGTTDQFNQLLQMQIHNYFDGVNYFQKPDRPGKIPSTLSDLILVIAGLNNQPQAKTHLHRIPEATAAVGTVERVKVTLRANGSTSGTTNGTPGQFTVADVANLYNINSLYQKHITGRGRTIGIATLATFAPSDAYTYWRSLGIKVSPNRITQVHVDGGGGTNGSDETTLDVEQAGGIAPDAKMIVYDAPNTDAGFIDVFYQAVADNKVDTLSVSWGSPEIAQSTDTMIAQHQAFIVAAAQGISVFASAGDAGAYDINDSNAPYTYPTCTQTLTVDSPASDPYVTAAGGTTLPNTQVRKNGTIVVPTERPWGWDYLQNYMTTYYGSDFYYANFFPVGGGGGVSVNYDMPLFQKSTTGTQLSTGNQSLVCSGTDYIDLPAGYAGRNVPDVSLNADPYTGYAVYFGGAWSYGSGGTSFVAPQLNGMASLLSQAMGGRVGLMSPQLYARFNRYGYSNMSPFNAITSGDNLYWNAGTQYNPATGLGTLNLNNLVNSFRF